MTEYWAEQMGITDPLTAARREAMAQGYAEGAKDGMKEGYSAGFSDGLKVGANMCEDWPTRRNATDTLRDVARAIRAVNLKPAAGSPRNPRD